MAKIMTGLEFIILILSISLLSLIMISLEWYFKDRKKGKTWNYTFWKGGNRQY